MTAFTGLVNNSPVVVPPLPSQKTLDLLMIFGVPYPGNMINAPTLELITLSEIVPQDTPKENIINFLKNTYPKLKPNTYTSVGISFENIVTSEPNVQSSIYNFYAVTNNYQSDIVPPETAKPLNDVITELERIYSAYALMFIMDLFYNHANNIDNPHQDNGTNLVNVWNDFFQALYNKYITLVSNPVDLQTFIFDKTTQYEVATLSGYTENTQALYIVTFEIVNALISTHNLATDSSIHPALQSTLSSETSLPIPSFYLTPDNFFYRYAPNLSGTGYLASALNSTVSRLQGTLFLQATVDITSTTTINILELSSSLSSDTLTIIKEGSEIGNYRLIYNISSIVSENLLYTTGNNIVLSFVYNQTDITITYLDENNNQQIINNTNNDLVFDFDTIQIYVPITYSSDFSQNILQKLSFYKTPLTSEQTSLLINTIIT